MNSYYMIFLFRTFYQIKCPFQTVVKSKNLFFCRIRGTVWFFTAKVIVKSGQMMISSRKSYTPAVVYVLTVAFLVFLCALLLTWCTNCTDSICRGHVGQVLYCIRLFHAYCCNWLNARYIKLLRILYS